MVGLVADGSSFTELPSVRERVGRATQAILFEYRGACRPLAGAVWFHVSGRRSGAFRSGDFVRCCSAPHERGSEQPRAGQPPPPASGAERANENLRSGVVEYLHRGTVLSQRDSLAGGWLRSERLCCEGYSAAAGQLQSEMPARKSRRAAPSHISARPFVDSSPQAAFASGLAEATWYDRSETRSHLRVQVAHGPARCRARPAEHR